MYKVKLTEEQIRIINKALDMYMRLEIGHFDYAIRCSDLFFKNIIEKFSREDFDESIAHLKSLFGFSLNSSYGIYSKEVCQNAREAYGILTVLRHQLWKDDPNKNRHTVDSDDMIIDCKLPKVEVEKDDEQ